MAHTLIRILAAISTLALAAIAHADTRIELIGRVNFNGLQLGRCLSTPCPWVSVRPGEWAYLTFIVDDAGTDLSANWPDCPNQIPRTISDWVYSARPGTAFARVGGISLSIPVLPSGISTSPALRLVSDNCSVDVLEIPNGLLDRGGRCCYPNGSCTYVKQPDCSGTWSILGACTATVNSCTQPTGACCAPDGSCTITLAAACATGTWSFGPCVPACNLESLGACCDGPSGSCAITVLANCAGVWTNGAICDTTICPSAGLLPDYALSIILRGPKTMFTNGMILDTRGYYPPSILAPDHSWSMFFQNDEMFIYDRTAFNLSADSTPLGSCCPGDGHCLVTTQIICPQLASWTSGGVCAPATCPAGSGACCKPDGSCELLNSAACAAIVNAVYQLDGSSCVNGACPPTGACCATGACTVVIQSACIATSGSWLGAGTTCAIAPENTFALSTIAGACCLAANGSCSFKYQSACAGAGQTWTPGTCAAPCPGTGAGSCCLNGSGACSIIIEANCINIQGTFTGNATCDAVPCTDLMGNPVGTCCNAVSGSCTVVVAAACSGGSTWNPVGTCATNCSVGTGSCCNTLDGSCNIRTQAFCTGSTVWTAGATCNTPCSSPGASLPDATFTSGQPDTHAIYTNVQTITDTQTVQSVEVALNITMSRLNDLRVRLTGPNGQSAELFARIDSKPPNCTATPIGAGRALFGTYIFADNAPQSLWQACTAAGVGVSPAPGRYIPSNCGGSSSSLNAPFAGISAAGSWTLTIIDERSGTRALVNSWGLSFNGGNPAPCTLGACVTGPSCSATTFAQCAGAWAVGSCMPITCPVGTPGACCLLDTCTVVCASQCPAQAMFAGAATACSPSICMTACCLSAGACTLTLPIACTGSAGPLGSTCTPNTCLQPVACCYPSGGCTLLLATRCIGGTAGASGSTCIPNTCPRPAAPTNDVCAAVFSSGPDVMLDANGAWISVGESLAGATESTGSPSCALGLPAADVWFRFTPPSAGTYRLQTCTTSPAWDTVLSVWSDCSSQLPGACSDDSCGTSPTVFGHATLNTALNPGLPLLIRVSAFAPYTTGVGPFTLRVEALGACCNSAGTCSLNTQAACAAISTATFRGIFSTCTPNPCPQPRACCNTTTNSCQLVAPSGCTAGRIVGAEGSTCSPFNPCPVGTCCRGATCSVTTAQIDCQAPGQIYTIGTPICNTPGTSTTPCCYADYDKMGGIAVADIFAFLNDWFTSSPFAATGGDGTTTPDVSSIFGFLNAWFSGGC